jgi:hypothetical protein
MRTALPRFKVESRPSGFRRGVDVLRLNQLNDELESEHFHRKLHLARRSRDSPNLRRS